MREIVFIPTTSGSTLREVERVHYNKHIGENVPNFAASKQSI